MSLFLKIVLFVLLVIAVWVSLEVIIQKNKQRALAEEVAERRRNARMEKILYGDPHEEETK